MGKWTKIEEIVKNTLQIHDADTRQELIEQITVYNEELVFQNEELRRINLNLEDLKNDYQQLFDFAPVNYFIINKEGLILKANNGANNLFGDLVGKRLDEYISSVSRKEFYEFLKELFEFGEKRKDVVFKVGNNSKHMEIIGKRVVSNEEMFLIACIDFEKQYQILEEIKRFSYRDYLTGLYNRRYLEKKIFEIIQQSRLPISVVVADVNGLKILNDAFGHSKGDELLEKAAEMILDISSDDSVVARVGGDEFAIVLPHTTSEQAERFVNKCSIACEKLIVDNIKFSVSFGVATMELITENIDDIITLAEENMYKSKLLGEAINTSEIVSSILEVLYIRQPIEKLQSKRVSEYMRALGEYLGLPDKTIELMYLSGLVHNIGKVAFNREFSDQFINLSDYDYKEMKKIPEIGYRILKNSSKYSKAAHVVLCAYERVNGKGYPKGLVDKEIPFEAKALSVCASFVSMTLDRKYSLLFTKDDALAELEASVGTKFDGEVVDSFVKMIKSM